TIPNPVPTKTWYFSADFTRRKSITRLPWGYSILKKSINFCYRTNRKFKKCEKKEKFL
ncbi:hypothetical protein L9F63_018259, partial [Diploptera punctata]